MRQNSFAGSRPRFVPMRDLIYTQFMKILVFLHGTLIMHQTGEGKSREERVRQSAYREKPVLDYANYIPIDNALEKVREWEKQGHTILYLSSHTSQEDVDKDKLVLERYNFPKGEVFWRKGSKTYAEIAEEIMPDVLIEDDCESIGGEKKMTYTNIKGKLKPRLKSIIVKEFEGIDSLPNNFQITT